MPLLPVKGRKGVDFMREAYMRDGPDHTDDAVVQKIILHCAQCPKDYPFNTVCPSCCYNVASYGVDIQRAQLLRVAYKIPVNTRNADVWHKQQEHEHKTTGRMAFIVVALLIATLVWICRDASKQGYIDFGYKPPMPTAQRIPAPNPNVQRIGLDNERIATMVEETLKKVATNIKDVTGDGQINCQDYAALFKRYYPDEAFIIYNAYIGSTGHVFNAVKAADGWYYIEPQRTKNWLMREAWPEYATVKQYNINMTTRFTR
jgi:hypothetical protein